VELTLSSGSVGQRFILLLADHPTLHLQAVGASSRSAGKAYSDAVRWKQARPMSSDLAGLVVRECKAENFQDCDLVFSGLDSDVAGEVGKGRTSVYLLCRLRLTLTSHRNGILEG
jgi:aspartate-semialdehyde dehydrogenase